MLGDVHDHGGFAHRGTRRYDDHFSSIHAAGHLVIVGKPRGQPSEPPGPLVELLDHVDGPAHQVLHRLDGGRFAILADAEDVAFNFVEQGVNLTLMFVDPSYDRGAGREHPAEDQFFADDLKVVGQVGRTGHGILKTAEVGESTDGFELVGILQLLLDRDEVDGMLVVIHVGQRLVDQLMPLVVEGFRTRLECLDTRPHCFVGGKQDAAKDSLFAFRGMRGQAIQRGDVQFGADPT